jgi:FlaA1/EpsC-like NDP-sugar epimerase
MIREFSETELRVLMGRSIRARVGAVERAAFAGRRVLITGAGGSIGGALAREIAACAPSALGLLDHSELGLFAIEREIRARHPDVAASAWLTDVTREPFVAQACRHVRPDVVFHAAAYKHVTMAERAPAAAGNVNVLGAAVMVEAARAAGARFVLVSSDKAAEPRSVMGATKRLAEIVTLAAASPAFRPIVVRFGNVLGSSGSVLQIMCDAIRRGQPIPLTDADATRYFMTPGEAVALLLKADLTARAPEILWLEMGRPIRMGDLAARVLTLEATHGYPAVPIEIVGLRAGEKRNETLADRRLTFRRSIDRRLRVARDVSAAGVDVSGALSRLRRAVARGDDAGALDVLRRTVEGFQPSADAQETAQRAGLARRAENARVGRKRRAA